MNPSGAAVPSELFMPSCFSQRRLVWKAEKDYGSIIQLLCSELKWDEAHLNNALAPEQQDAVALAILAYKEGRGFLLADMAGFGKGRIVATIAYYMKLNGIFPIISTINANLFSNLAIDFRDIGVLDFMGRPFLLNTGAVVEDIHLSDTPLLYPKIKPKEYKAILAFGEGGKDIASQFGFMLMTYSQLQKQGSEKVRFVHSIADHNKVALINDEAHSIARFFAISSQIYYDLGQKAVFRIESTATAGRGATDLRSYSKTYPWLSTLPFPIYDSLSERALGVMASMSTVRALATGRMIRRENDRTGITFEYVMPDAQTAQTIDRLDKFGVELFGAMYKLAICNWKSVSQLNSEQLEDKAPEWSSPDFFGMTGRLSRQLTACMIAEAVGNIAVDMLNKGYKPFIAMDVTLDSLLRDDDRDDDIEIKDVNFALLAKELVDELSYIFNRKKEKFSITDDDLINKNAALEARSAIYKIHKIIDSLPDVIPSPLDTIREIVSNAKKPNSDQNWTITEISGRNQQLVNGEFVTIKESRNTRTAKFNNGEYDAIVCTRAMSTGQSFHAAPFFKDQRQRMFLEGVPPENPLQRSQMHGRVQRRGELSKPFYLGVNTGLTYHEGRLRHLSRKDDRMNASVRGEQSGGLFLADIERFAVSEVLSEHPNVLGKMGMSGRFQREEDIVDTLYRRSYMIAPQERKLIFDEVAKRIESRKSDLEHVLQQQEKSDAGTGWVLKKELLLEGSHRDGTSVTLQCLEREVEAPLKVDLKIPNDADQARFEQALAELMDAKSSEEWLKRFLPKWAKSVKHALSMFKRPGAAPQLAFNLVGRWHERTQAIIHFLKKLTPGCPLTAPNQFGVLSSARVSHIIPPAGSAFRWDEWLIYYTVAGFDELLVISLEQFVAERYATNNFYSIGLEKEDIVTRDFARLYENSIERIYVLGGVNPAGIVSWADGLGPYIWSGVNYQRKDEPNSRYGVMVAQAAVQLLDYTKVRLYTCKDIVDFLNWGGSVQVSAEAGQCRLYQNNLTTRLQFTPQGNRARYWKKLNKEIAELYEYEAVSSNLNLQRSPNLAIERLLKEHEFFITRPDYKAYAADRGIKLTLFPAR